MKFILLVDINIEGLEELLGDARSVEEIPEGLSRHCEPAWHRNADIYHLTQACALAAHCGKVVLSHFFQPNNSVHQIIHLSLQVFVSAQPSLITLYEAFTRYIEYIQKHISLSGIIPSCHVQTLFRCERRINDSARPVPANSTHREIGYRRGGRASDLYRYHFTR